MTGAEYRGLFHMWLCPSCEETQETLDDVGWDEPLHCENCGWEGRLNPEGA